MKKTKVKADPYGNDQEFEKYINQSIAKAVIATAVFLALTVLMVFVK